MTSHYKQIFSLFFSFLFISSVFSQTKLTVMGWRSSEFEEQNLKDLLRKYEQLNPDVKINYISIPDDYNAQFSAKVKSQSLPDIFYVRQFDTKNPEIKTAILPLNSYLKNSKIRVEDFYTSSIRSFISDGSLYAIPKDFNIIGFLVNEKYRKSAGLSQNGPKDWNEFSDWIKQLDREVKKENPDITYGCGFGMTGDDYELLPFYAQLLSSNRSDSEINYEKEKAAQVFGYFSRLDSSQLIKPSFNSQWMINDFGSGRVGSMISGIWFFPYLKNKFPETEFHIYKIPKLNNKVYNQSVLTAVGWGISAKCNHPDDAWKLIEFLSSSFDLKSWEENTIAFPAQKKFLNEIKKSPENYFGAFDLLNTIDNSISMGLWNNAELQLFSERVRMMIVTKSDPEKTAAEIEEILNRNKN